ncbi:AAA family ATPase [Mycolicibacterium neoaurum]|uniref:AAA family ATPase n=1 Tax=Mycolicibacterium neoaurum TaxID=1795 RepID=UPI001F4D1354|nr:AAA family ATPase [Mycolicibacterium neoaurum]
MLEILSAAAHHLGLSAGLEHRRGESPFHRPDERIIIDAIAPITQSELSEQMQQALAAAGTDWTGQLRVASGNGGPVVSAPSAPAELQERLAIEAINAIRPRTETHHLYLDAERSYVGDVGQHEFGELVSRKWDDPLLAKQSAHRSARSLYDEWLRYLYGRDQREATEHVAALRRAASAGEPAPPWVDWLVEYKAMLKLVLPHLEFIGVGTPPEESPRPKFNSSGTVLDFPQLSSGEREIAFLTGQIDRFKLRRGLLLIDEPELHLNPDLLRTWLQFVRDTVSAGQVWAATHSLEAAEVAGPASTFVFEREPDTRLVSSPGTVEGRPVLAALSKAIGSPAFAIHRRRFIFIEGDSPGAERQRFYDVVGNPEKNRFIEGGSCGEITRRLRDVKTLADESDEQLHVGGVLDRDFRTAKTVRSLTNDYGLHVLGCHEVENLYLHPDSIKIVLRRGMQDDDPNELIRRCGDEHASLWIVQCALSMIPEGQNHPSSPMSVWTKHTWTHLQNDWASLRAASVASVDPAFSADWGVLLDSAYQKFSNERTESNWWRRCLGKQTVSSLTQAVGFNSPVALRKHIHAIWAEPGAQLPDDLVKLRDYVETIEVG